MKALTGLLLNGHFLALLLVISAADVGRAAAEPFRLGAIAPLSGEFAPYGNHVREGVELAQEALREKGIETQAFFEDACLPKDARSAAQKLITSGKIQALVGSWCVVGMIPTAPLFDAAGIPAFHTSEVPRALLRAGTNVFTTNARIGDEAARLADYAFYRLGLRRVAVLSLTTQWGQEFDDTFTESFTRLGGSVVARQSTPIGQNDFRAELTRFRAKKPDALFIVHLGSTLATAILQAKSLGMNLPMLAASDAEEAAVLDAAKGAAEGLTLFAPEPERISAEMKDFDTRFVRHFRRKAHPLARHSYDATLLAGAKLEECRGDTRCARDRILGVTAYAGASGTISIDSDRGTSREFVMKTVKGDHFERATGIRDGVSVAVVK